MLHRWIHVEIKRIETEKRLNPVAWEWNEKKTNMLVYVCNVYQQRVG